MSTKLAYRRADQERWSMATSKVIAIGKLASVSLLQDIVERLRKLGHDVTFHEDAAAFHRAPASVTDADAMVAAPSFTCSREIMNAASKLRGIISPVIGIEGVDIGAATELGILVANGQVRENVAGMAEATVLLVLASLYDLHGSEAVLRQNRP